MNYQTPHVAELASATLRQFSKAKVIAKKLGVCTRTIFRWADEGKIARYKINARVVLFDEAEVNGLLKSARIAAAHQ